MVGLGSLIWGKDTQLTWVAGLTWPHKLRSLNRNVAIHHNKFCSPLIGEILPGGIQTLFLINALDSWMMSTRFLLSCPLRIHLPITCFCCLSDLQWCGWIHNPLFLHFLETHTSPCLQRANIYLQKQGKKQQWYDRAGSGFDLWAACYF